MDVEFDDRRFIETRTARARSPTRRSMCTTSRSSPPMAAASSASRRCCAGPIRCAAPSRPCVFVPVAEQIRADGHGSARSCCAARWPDAKRWPELYVAVNLSPVQVRDPALVDLVVRRAGRERGVAPSRLMLEVTEGVLIDNPDEAKARLDDLHGARRAPRARRFRLRLFEPQLSAALPVRQAQDRPQLRRRARPLRRQPAS